MPWPRLAADQWEPTRQTLHLWTQIVGKTRLALSPRVNQWWNVPLYITPRGLTTGSMPYSAGLCEIAFDLVQSRLRLFTSDGGERELALRAASVAEFYGRYRALLDEAGVAVKLWPVPVEIEDATPFDRDDRPRSYDPDAARRFWETGIVAHTLLTEFRSRFAGKCSPVHFFWGSFDLAVTRFSGRPAPVHPPTPGLADFVVREAYSEEVSSAGRWPGGGGRDAAFYAYAYPAPPGFADAPVAPGGFDPGLEEFVLPYEEARTAPDPRGAVLDFLQSSYEAAADLAHWRRADLERAGD